MRILAAPDAHDELPRSARRATDTGGSDDVAGGYDQRPEAVADNGIKHHHLDHVGTPRLVTDRCGATRSTHDYYPFGEQIGTSADRERMKFTGHKRDHPYPPSTLGDLDYMHARSYTPYLGRFVSVDPGRDHDSKVPQSWNLYAYVRGNPIRSVDPTGQWGEDFHLLVTQYLALSAGRSPGDALEIAMGNQAVDDTLPASLFVPAA